MAISATGQGPAGEWLRWRGSASMQAVCRATTCNVKAIICVHWHVTASAAAGRCPLHTHLHLPCLACTASPCCPNQRCHYMHQHARPFASRGMHRRDRLLPFAPAAGHFGASPRPAAGAARQWPDYMHQLATPPFPPSPLRPWWACTASPCSSRARSPRTTATGAAATGRGPTPAWMS